MRTIISIIIIFGVAGVFSSAMVYHCTPRFYWNFMMTGPKFFLTAIILGSAAVLIISILHLVLIGDVNTPKLLQSICEITCTTVIIATIAKMAAEHAIVLPNRKLELNPVMKIINSDLRDIAIFRMFSGLIGGIILPLYLYYQVNPIMHSPYEFICLSSMIFILSLMGEFFERRLFFMAASTTSMPKRIVN